jgi:pimeloyl-ACP methyl ester carboxylesterase
VRLYYEEAGSGAPVLLIHGAGFSADCWRHNVPTLAQQFRVVAPDTRGCGQSERPDWGHGSARYAQDVRQIIEALSLEDVTLVGWSIGARTCYAYLELFGGQGLRGVAIVDDTVHHTVHEPTPAAAEQQPGESDEAFLRRTMRQMFAPEDPGAMPDTEVERMIAALTPMPETLKDNYQGQDWRPLCPTIDVPVLVVSGRYSGALPGCRYAAEHIPGARLEILEHSGHGLFFTEADRFNQLLADFVRHATT